LLDAWLPEALALVGSGFGLAAHRVCEGGDWFHRPDVDHIPAVERKLSALIPWRRSSIRRRPAAIRWPRAVA